MKIGFPVGRHDAPVISAPAPGGASSGPGKVYFALSNVRNHIQDVGGPEGVELVLVLHGTALKAFLYIRA